jgi:hypothetical protein
MKADVPAALAVPQLIIPSWVPEPIAQHVRTMQANDIASIRYEMTREDDYFDVAVFQDELAGIVEHYSPLVCDRRMQGVWRELTRKRDGAFLHPALSGDQDAALVELFDTALMCQIRREATTTRGHVEQERDRFLAKAAELQRDAAEMDWEYFTKLLAAAQVYRDHASKIYTANIATVLEYQHDGRARWVALTISAKFRELFASPMYGLSAIITSIIRGREITSRTVRSWCDNLPQYAI